METAVASGEGPGAVAEGLASLLRSLGGELEATRVLSRCLTMAARRGDAALAKELLARGANPEMAEEPLSEDDGASMKLAGAFWATPWLAALAADSAECLQAMAEAGMDPVSPRVMWRQQRLGAAGQVSRAIHDGRESCSKIAIKWATDNDQRLWETGLSAHEGLSGDAWESLCDGQAGARQAAGIAKALAACGVDLDGRSKKGVFKGVFETPLEMAAANGNAEVLEGLLEAGANPRKGRPVRSAIKSSARGALKCLGMLLEAGADPEAGDRGPAVKTPLVMAVENGDAAKARTLIAAGACSGKKGAHGLSLLALAAIGGSDACVELLLAEGFDPDESLGSEGLAAWSQRVCGTLSEGVGNPQRCAQMLRAASEAKSLEKSSGNGAAKKHHRRI